MGLSVKIPGSCGELVQGMIDDIPFLVTCPISMYTKASITKYFSYLNRSLRDLDSRPCMLLPRIGEASLLLSDFPIHAVYHPHKQFRQAQQAYDNAHGVHL